MGQCGRIQNLRMLIARGTAPSWIIESILKHEMNHGNHRTSPPPIAAVSREARKSREIRERLINSQSGPPGAGQKMP